MYVLSQGLLNYLSFQSSRARVAQWVR